MEYLNGQGVAVHRAPLSSPTGDLDGLEWAVLEAKDQREQRLAIWVDQAIAEAEKKSTASGKPVVPIVIAKRRMKPTRDAYAILPLWAITWILTGDLFDWYNSDGTE